MIGTPLVEFLNSKKLVKVFISLNYRWSDVHCFVSFLDLLLWVNKAN